MNDLFREHVTSVGFSLTLGKTHIAALVELDHRLRLNLRDPFVSYGAYVEHRPRHLPRAFAHSVTGHNGLIGRGLVEHIVEARRKPGERYGSMTPRRCWRITPAGRMVINLLKEAGLYQEYAAYLPPLPSSNAELKKLRDTLNSYNRDEMIEYGEKVRPHMRSVS